MKIVCLFMKLLYICIRFQKIHLSIPKPMRKFLTFMLALGAYTAAHAITHIVLVRDTRYQTVTGFGAACCDGAMQPYGTDTQPVRLLYGPTSAIGLNIMRMEISPSFQGEGWGNYNWNGSLVPSDLSAVQGIGSVVDGKLVFLTVQLEFTLADSISIAADECGEVWFRTINDAFNCVVTLDNVCVVSVTVRYHNSN